MRYFDSELVANSAHHALWWGQTVATRENFHNSEASHAALMNQSAILPRDAWLELDTITKRVMRDDEGQAFMADLMPLAKTVNIGKLAHLHRVSSDTGEGKVVRSLSGQMPVGLDKVTYDYRGAPVPIFATGFKREWREWSTLSSENFDAIADDQEAETAKIKRDQADYALDGDDSIKVDAYSGYGIRTSTYSNSINLGSAGGGANIDLTDAAATSDQIEAFFNGPFGAMLDANLVASPVNLYISPEIARGLPSKNWPMF